MRNGRNGATPGVSPVKMLWAMLVVMTSTLIACGDDSSEHAVVVRTADQIQVVSPAEAERLLDEGERRSSAPANGARTTKTTVGVEESSRSFQTRLGSALAVFNACLADRGMRFVGLPGQSDDPLAEDPDYVPSLIACNNESGMAAVLQEQGDRQSQLSADQKKALNEDAQDVFECLIDRGWDFGPLEPNENGILTTSSFPDDIGTRPDEFSRDLDACGWNDLDLG